MRSSIPGRSDPNLRRIRAISFASRVPQDTTPSLKRKGYYCARPKQREETLARAKNVFQQSSNKSGWAS